ncbi:hypothetical protein Nepgr_010899 [Nepenthes gracilis]|uniref:Reverse transcriptase n=1 Tax=Nepenthes gracilis TaxID=150966 RepID=A0AAD3XLR9_NEPGR|nr:hypothetical protein Nepgr_010899 [Nepenthes gracilis]
MPSNSIRSFQELEKQPWHLARIKQGPNENLKSFLSRFTSEARRIPRLTNEVKLNTFIANLEPGRVFKHLAHTNPQTFREVEVTARAYVAAEEANEAKKPARVNPPYQGSPKMRNEDERSYPKEPRRKFKNEARREFRPFDPTPLNDSRINILMQIREEKFFKWPRAPKNHEGGDQSKFCHYHRSPGHGTEECWTLQREIEMLIRKGHLKKFLKKPEDNSGERLKEEETEQPQLKSRVVAEVVNMITTRPAKAQSGQMDVIRSDRKRKFESDDVISFSKEDMDHVRIPHSNPLVVSALVSDGNVDYQMKRIFIDNGSSSNLLYFDAFIKLGLKINQLRPANGPLYGVGNEPVTVKGTIQLEVTLRTYPKTASHELTFLVVDLPLVYNTILGRPCLAIFGAVTSIPHLKMKFATLNGVGEILRDQVIGRTCYLSQVEKNVQDRSVEDFDYRDESTLQQAQSREVTDLIPLDPTDPKTCVQIGNSLTEPVRGRLIEFLWRNKDVFAWTSSDMLGIPTEVMVHKLSLDPNHKPIRQKRRNYSVEKLIAIREEVKNLLDAGFIRKVQYPDWLSNVVMVKKSNGKWRMCVDFTNLNKACPKDSFPLPRIDLLVDSTSGHELLSFMDAYSGYNQISMSPEDEEHTSFMTDQGTYCYKIMPFGLKNAGATYQRLVNKLFADQISRNMEVYVDDMLIKSKVMDDHTADLEEAFEVLRKHRMKLNPTKCAFGVSSDKFLGFIVSKRGIEANPEKIMAVAEMSPPKTIKEVQRLTGRLTALSRFLSKSAEKYLPFFKVLRGTKANDFQWTEECQTAFQNLKDYLASPPLLTSPLEGDELFLYLAVSDAALSSVLIQQQADVQRPIYYVSKILSDVESRYIHAEKIVLALVYSARKLRPYFQAHKITVLTDQPLKGILQKLDTSGRLVKWAIELGEFDIEYKPRPSIKGQVLADFLVETSFSTQNNEAEDQKIDRTELSNPWTMYVDGSSTQSGSGAGVILRTPEGMEILYSLRLSFPTTNNVAEYEALLAGLRLARECSAKYVAIYSDSELMVNQVRGDFEVSNSCLAKCIAKVRSAF